MLWVAACSQGSDHCDPFIASFSSLPIPLRRRRLLGEPKGGGELGEPSLEAQPHGGKKQLMGVRGWCFPPGGQFAGLQPLRVCLPTRAAVPGTAAAAQDVGWEAAVHGPGEAGAGTPPRKTAKQPRRGRLGGSNLEGCFGWKRAWEREHPQGIFIPHPLALPSGTWPG